MLGWSVTVIRDTKPRELIVRWEACSSGLSWLHKLVQGGQASKLHDNGGYPDWYKAPAGVLLPIIAKGVPVKDVLSLGEGEIAPKGWKTRGGIIWEQEQIDDYEDDEMLLIKVWDLS